MQTWAHLHVSLIKVPADTEHDAAPITARIILRSPPLDGSSWQQALLRAHGGKPGIEPANDSTVVSIHMLRLVRRGSPVRHSNPSSSLPCMGDDKRLHSLARLQRKGRLGTSAFSSHSSCWRMQDFCWLLNTMGC